MAAYRVSVKESVFEWTGTIPEDLGPDREIRFRNEVDAQTWVDAVDEQLGAQATLVLHEAHPDDTSGVDAYLTVRPKGLWTVE